jgi:hypothetical protein
MFTSEMAKDVIEIPLATARRLQNAFAEGFTDSKFEKTTSLSTLKLVNEPAAANELIVNPVSIDNKTGLCSRSGAQLRLIRLEEDDKEQLLQAVLSLSRAAQMKFVDAISIPKENVNTARADDELMAFHKWLDKREGEPYTAIIDAPNVGYNMQNYEDGRFSFQQIKFVVDSLEKAGEHPLVVLPQKYMGKHFHVSVGSGGSGGAKKQYITKKEEAIRRSLLESGRMFSVPRGLLDDFYWILASVSNQTTSKQGRDLSVANDNSEGRWPGARPILISNDQMRDHKLEMLEPRVFRRWYSTYIVNYSFPGYVNEKSHPPEISFSSPDSFSREIQGNPTKDGATVWHFPIIDTDDEWLCVRIPCNK